MLMGPSNPIMDNVSADQARQARTIASQNALTLGNYLRNEADRSLTNIRNSLSAAWKDDGFLDPATKKAIANFNRTSTGPGPFPDVLGLADLSNQVQQKFTAEQRDAMQNYGNRFSGATGDGRMLIPGAAKGGVAAWSPSANAPAMYKATQDWGNMSNNIFGGLLQAKLAYAEMQKRNDYNGMQQALANAAGAAGMRANLQNTYGQIAGNLYGQVGSGMTHAFNPQQVDLKYGAMGGEGGGGVNGHVSSYYGSGANTAAPEINTQYNMTPSQKISYKNQYENSQPRNNGIQSSPFTDVTTGR